ncbi:MAG: TlpA family protein disulfide reductase [Marinilabiliaceae bacterium]|nr:TlpA family protein disulfide reductase [Marinilabiliaceae bacterium]
MKKHIDKEQMTRDNSSIGLLMVLATTICGLFFSTQAIAQNTSNKVKISVRVKDYPNAPVVLGYYYNKQMLVADTLMTNEKCVALLERDSLYKEGIYMIYIPERSYMDIIMTDNQQFSITCDTLKNMIERADCKGNDVLKQFLDYQKYLGSMQREYQSLSEQFKAAKGDTALQSTLRRRYADCERSVKEHNQQIIDANKDNFFSVFLTALKEPETPHFDVPEGTAGRDSILQTRSYYWYRAHWDDNIDFSDERLLRTPFLVAKVDKYMAESPIQMADTIADECIQIIEKARPDKDAFRYWVSHFYNMANDSKVMGMDGALVRLADAYYLSGQAYWAEEKFISDLREQIDGIRYTLIGHKAVDLKRMPSVNGEYFTLSEVKAPYTILVFWEPSCGHCKKEIPRLKEEVWDKFKDKGIRIFAVYCQVEKEEWETFISEHQLDEWINVYDPYGRTGFRKYYNIKSTPQIFIIDDKMEIVAKRLGVEQIPDFLNHYLNLKRQ